MSMIQFGDLSDTICCALFLIVISILYYNKPKVATIENYVYSFLIFILGLLLILETDSIIFSYKLLNKNVISFIYELRYAAEIIWALLFLLYIIISTSRKNQGYIPYSQNKEKKYFNKIIIIFSIIIFGCIIAVISLDVDYSIYGDLTESGFSNLIFKSCFVLLSAWVISIIYYLIIRYRYNKNKVDLTNIEVLAKRRIILLSLLFIIIILFIMLIIDKVPNFTYYTIGYGVYFKFLVVFISVLILNIQMIENAESINPRRFIPIIIFTPFWVLALLLNLNYPNLLPESAIFAVETIYIYFTIENPDVKMIQELNLSREEADNANLQKTRFLSVMSHEIRTPLNAIVGFGQTLKEADISKEAKEEVEDIIMASNNLLDIVNGILDISKIETDDLEIVEKDYDSQKMFKEIVALAKARLSSRPIDLRINIDVSIPPVLHGDYLRVKQVIVNILTNSIKYTRDGYIDFQARAISKGEKVDLDITVKDSGIGIKEEDLGKLFTKFQRLDLEKNSSTEGTGLGLAITKRLVELMNGSIDVSSVYGKGTTFNIKLEQGIVHKNVDDVTKNDELKVFVKISPDSRILVVDDNAMNVKVFSRLLTDYNVIADTASSGEECINKVKTGNRYDLIFMDDMMPNLTGTKTLELLKELPEFNTPVIAFTANAISGMREQYLANGFSEYLAKPVKKEDLNDILDLFIASKTNYSANPQIKVVPQLKVAAGYDVPIQTPNVMDVKTPFTKSEPELKIVEVNMHNPNRTKEFLEKNGVDVEHGIGILGDLDTYNMLIDDFDKNINERIENIKRLKEIKDWENYAIETHDLKKDAKYLGFVDLVDIAYKHELAGKAENEEEINELFSQLVEETEKISKIVKAYCKG